MRPSRLGSSAVTLYAAFLFLRQSPAMAQSDVQTVLDRVTSAVRARYLSGYLVSIDRYLHAAPHYGPGVGGTAFDGESLDPLIPFKDAGSHDIVTLARLGHRVRCDVHNKGDQRWQWLTDGHTLWTYRQDVGLYTEESAKPWPQPLGPGPGLPGLEWKYIAKFLALSGIADHARIVSDDLAPTAECPGPSVLLEITIPGGKEELRVLSRSSLPCQTVIHWSVSPKLALPTDFDEAIVWKFAPDPPAPSLFVFAPRKHAKRVKQMPRVD